MFIFHTLTSQLNSFVLRMIKQLLKEATVIIGIHSFVHGTNISQSGRQKDFLEVDKITSGSSYKTLKSWENTIVFSQTSQ